MFASSEHACDHWHSSRESTALTGWHCKLCSNTEGNSCHSVCKLVSLFPWLLGLARGVMEECDVISVVTEFMFGRRFGSRCDGRV
jgi:hypothetical protein